MTEKKFNDKDFLVNLRDVLKTMQGGLTKELENRVDRLKNIHEEYKDVIVQAQAWHEQEKERAAEKETKKTQREQSYKQAEEMSKNYGG